jgi:hypothetical protein
MASIITATTTSGLTQSADNSGVLQLASGSGNLVTVPSVTGTAMVSGNMPAFRGYLASNLSVSNGTNTQITFNTEQFDTASAYSSGVFTVPVTGYYEVKCFIAWSGDIAGQWQFNWSVSGGSPVYTNAYQIDTATLTGTNHGLGGSDLLYLTAGQSLTSYLAQATGTTKTVTAGGETFASIVLVRTA